MDELTENQRQDLITANVAAQMRSAEYSNKVKAKYVAIETASKMRPSAYEQGGIGALQRPQNVNYDIISQAEIVYQWLIKDL